MNMTHYMELLAVNQPWNLLIFMAGPVILAETLAITEFYLLYTRRLDGPVAVLNRVCSVLVGLYFAGILVYLIPHVLIPVTQEGQWRTVIDQIAVGAYVLSGLPMIYIALQELGLVGRCGDAWQRLKRHATCVAAFLVLAHVAMIAGMLDPGLLGWKAPGTMNGMQHDEAMAMHPTMAASAPEATASAHGGHLGHDHP